WYDSDGGNKAIDPKTFWDNHYSGTKPGPYVLLLDTGNAGDISAAPVRHRVPVEIPRAASATEPPLSSPLRQRRYLL
ncbi:MAG: hypothetical protein QNL88_08185, partial [Acidobacteriota bacterium]|nr:hypothetical protein [Acidobacteriota bacterium]